MPGASAAIFSSVALPGGTEISTSRNCTAAKIAHTTHDGGIVKMFGHVSANPGALVAAAAIGVSMTPGSTRAMWMSALSS